MSHWFKFYGQEFLSDTKMLSLSAIERSLWLTMLCLASSSDEEGVIKYIDETKIMMMTNISPLDDEWENTGFLAKFEELGMITVKDKVITLLNFNKRQETNLTNAERQARYRSNKDNVTKVTLDKNRIEENRVDKNIINTNVLTVAKPQYGKPEINELIDYLKEKLQLKTLDLSVEKNRYATQNLLNKYKSKDVVIGIIDAISQDDFYRNNVTSMQDVLNKAMKIMSRKRGDTPKIAVMPQEL